MIRNLWLFAGGAEAADPVEAPGEPQNLTTDNVEDDQIRLNWDAPATGDPPDSYTAQISTSSGFGTILESKVVDAPTTRYTFRSLTADTEYWLRVRAKNAGGTSDFAGPISETTLAEPPPPDPTPDDPTELTASEDTAGVVTLNWVDNSDNEDGFAIERAVDGGSFTEIDTVAANITTYDDSVGAVNEACYRVRAFNEDGGTTYYSEYTNTACVDNTDAPGTPTSLSASVVSGSQIDLSWSSGGGSPDEYEIFRNDVLFDTISSASTTYSATGLDEATTYTWKVRAKKGTSVSDFSNEETQATKLNAPTNFQGTQNGSGELGFVTFSWTDNSTNEDEYVLIKNGTDFRTLPANTTSTDVDNTETEPSDEWTLQARASSHINSNLAGPLTGFPES